MKISKKYLVYICLLGGLFLLNNKIFANTNPAMITSTYSITIKNAANIPLVASTRHNNTFLEPHFNPGTLWLVEPSDLAPGASTTVKMQSDAGVFAGFTYTRNFSSIEGCQIKLLAPPNKPYFYPMKVVGGNNFSCEISNIEQPGTQRHGSFDVTIRKL